MMQSLARCLLCTGVLLGSLAPLFAQTKPVAFRVAGYLPDYRLDDFDFAAAEKITDLILFSAEAAASGELDLARLEDAPWSPARDLEKVRTKSGARVILAVGGWGRCKHFAAVASSPELRAKFVASAIKTCQAKEFDGLDLDWEHPENETEQQAYADLLADLRKGFAPHGLKLSVTMAAWQRIPKQAFEAVDWVQIMAYDHEGKHSTFENAKADVEKLIATGAPRDKIVLGLPFYGRDIAKRDVTKTYRQLVAEKTLGADVDEVGGVYFNGPQTIARKVQYAWDEKLAGVMIWELGQDAAGDKSLLKVIDKTLWKDVK